MPWATSRWQCKSSLAQEAICFYPRDTGTEPQGLQQIFPQTEVDFCLGRAVSTLPEKILPCQLSRGSGPRAVCCETGQGTWPAQTTPQGAVIRLLGSNKCGFKFVQMWVQVCVYMRVRVCALIRLTVSLPSQCGSRLSLSKSPGSAQHKCLPSTT